MKRSIRIGVFETNSSSTHSLTMCTEEEYKKWENGEVLANIWDNKFITREEAIKEFKDSKYYNDTDWEDEEEVNEMLKDEKIESYEEFFTDNYRFATFKDTYITKGGEKVIAFGKYGYDG